MRFKSNGKSSSRAVAWPLSIQFRKTPTGPGLGVYLPKAKQQQYLRIAVNPTHPPPPQP